MKKGTVEYTIRTEKRKEDCKEKIESEFSYKVRGYDLADTFDPETINQNLVDKIRKEHSRLLLSNPNISRYESRLIEKIPYKESENNEE